MWTDSEIGFPSYTPSTHQNDPGTDLITDLHLHGGTSGSLTSSVTVQPVTHPDSVPFILPNTSHEFEEPLRSPAPLSNMIGHSGSDNSAGNTSRATKRTVSARHEKSSSRKSVTNKHSKRSMTLEEKGKELTDMTGAFVVIYTARPESVGDGTHRFFVSENLGGRDGPLGKRILDEITVVSKQAASLAGHPVDRPHKKARTRHTVHQLEIGSSSQGAGSSPAHPGVAFTLHADEVDQPAIISGEPGKVGWSLEGEINIIVHLLKDDTKIAQSSALAMMSKLVLSDHGVAIVHEADAIPRLIELLNPNPERDYEISHTSLSVLSHMANHRRACMAMVEADIISPLIRLLSLPMNGDILVLVMRTISKCCQQLLPGKTFHSLVIPNLLWRLIGFLSASQLQLLFAAVETMDSLMTVGDRRVSKYLLKKGVVQQLCDLFSRCCDLPLLEKLASAIGRITRNRRQPYYDEFRVINECVLQPMLSLLENRNIMTQIGACRALRLCYSYELADSARATVLPQLEPLLSSDDDELFIEAAYVFLLYMSPGYSHKKDHKATTIPRIIRLLYYGNKQVLVNAVHCMTLLFTKYGSDNEICLEMYEFTAIQRLVSLIGRHDSDLALAAIKAVVAYYAQIDATNSAVITSVVRYATSGLPSSAELRTLFDMAALLRVGEDEAKALIQADLLVPLVLLLSSQEGASNHYLVSFIQKLAQSNTSFEIVLLDAGFVRPFIASLDCLLVDWTSYPDEECQWVWDGILSWIRHSTKFRLALKAAGGERALSDVVAEIDNEWVAEKLDHALDVLANTE